MLLAGFGLLIEVAIFVVGGITLPEIRAAHEAFWDMLALVNCSKT